MFSEIKNNSILRNANRSALCTNALVLCMALLGARVSVAQEAKAGWVLDLNGQWAISGTTTLLAQAASVPAGGQLVDLAPKDRDYIRIADLHGDLLKSIRCSKTGCGQCVKNQDSCVAPIDPLPKAPEQPGLLAATWEGLMDLFAGQPERYSVHRSRSLGVDKCIADGVAPIDASGNAHLDGILKDCDAGVYAFEFSLAGERAQQNAQEATVTWDPKAVGGSAVAVVQPGLYRAKFTRDQRSGSAWILLSTASSYEVEKASFANLSAVVDGWGPEVERDEKVAYKRAYLDYLSRSKGGADQVR